MGLTFNLSSIGSVIACGNKTNWVRSGCPGGVILNQFSFPNDFYGVLYVINQSDRWKCQKVVWLMCSMPRTKKKKKRFRKLSESGDAFRLCGLRLHFLLALRPFCTRATVSQRAVALRRTRTRAGVEQNGFGYAITYLIIHAHET